MNIIDGIKSIKDSSLLDKILIGSASILTLILIYFGTQNIGNMFMGYPGKIKSPEPIILITIILFILFFIKKFWTVLSTKNEKLTNQTSRIEYTDITSYKIGLIFTLTGMLVSALIAYIIFIYTTNWNHLYASGFRYDFSIYYYLNILFMGLNFPFGIYFQYLNMLSGGDTYPGLLFGLLTLVLNLFFQGYFLAKIISAYRINGFFNKSQENNVCSKLGLTKALVGIFKNYFIIYLILIGLTLIFIPFGVTGIIIIPFLIALLFYANKKIQAINEDGKLFSNPSKRNTILIILSLLVMLLMFQIYLGTKNMIMAFPDSAGQYYVVYFPFMLFLVLPLVLIINSIYKGYANKKYWLHRLHLAIFIIVMLFFTVELSIFTPTHWDTNSISNIQRRAILNDLNSLRDDIQKVNSLGINFSENSCENLSEDLRIDRLNYNINRCYVKLGFESGIQEYCLKTTDKYERQRCLASTKPGS